MRLPASARVVLNNLPGTVLDVVQRSRMSERLVRLRVWELKRHGAIKVSERRNGWAVYEAA